jgi:uncharacterized protein involved in outer membrane biogenesis
MRKILKWVGWTLVTLILLLVLGVVFVSGPLIKHVVNTAGPRLLGVPVTLQKAAFSPFTGRLTLQGLYVGNPAGFKTPGLFELDTLDIDVDMTTLFKPVVVITEIRIAAPEITYEWAIKDSNIGALLDQLSSKDAAPEPTPAAPAAVPATESGKKVVIAKLTISGARVHATAKVLGGHAAVLPLPVIELANIGGEDKDAQGVTLVEALRKILGAVLTGVTKVVAGAGHLAVDGVKAVGGVAVDGVKAVGASVGKARDNMRNLIGRGDKDEPASKPEP